MAPQHGHWGIGRESPRSVVLANWAHCSLLAPTPTCHPQRAACMWGEVASKKRSRPFAVPGSSSRRHLGTTVRCHVAAGNADAPPPAAAACGCTDLRVVLGTHNGPGARQQCQLCAATAGAAAGCFTSCTGPKKARRCCSAGLVFCVCGAHSNFWSGDSPLPATLDERNVFAGGPDTCACCSRCPLVGRLCLTSRACPRPRRPGASQRGSSPPPGPADPAPQSPAAAAESKAASGTVCPSDLRRT